MLTIKAQTYNEKLYNGCTAELIIEAAKLCTETPLQSHDWPPALMNLYAVDCNSPISTGSQLMSIMSFDRSRKVVLLTLVSPATDGQLLESSV